MSVNPNTLFKSHQLSHRSVSASIEYRVTYALVFMVCLAITGLCRLLPRNRHPWICTDCDGSGSLWHEARSAADSTVPYVFHQ